jgi:hypothetical protein
LYLSILSSCISEYSREAEDALLPYFKKLSLQPDTAFFNQLIKTRALRKEPERGIATLDLMREWGAAPDILTFGCLALCCTSYKEAARLMADLKARMPTKSREIIFRWMIVCEMSRT